MFTAHKFGQWCCGPSAGICRCTRRRPFSSKYAGFVIISVTRCRMPCAFFMDQHFKFTQNSFKIQISSTFRITSMKYVLASERMRICALLARRSFNTSKADGTFPTITSIEWLLCDDMTLTKGMLWSTWLICSRVTPWSCSSQRLWSLMYFRPLFVCKTKHKSNKAVCCSYIKSVHCMFPKAATFVHCSSDNPLTTDWSLSASIRDLFAGAKYAIRHYFFLSPFSVFSSLPVEIKDGEIVHCHEVQVMEKEGRVQRGWLKARTTKARVKAAHVDFLLGLFLSAAMSIRRSSRLASTAIRSNVTDAAVENVVKECKPQKRSISAAAAATKGGDSKKRKSDNGVVKAPENWEIVYDKIKEYRKTAVAPVDTMGCERLAEDGIPDKVFLFA